MRHEVVFEGNAFVNGAFQQCCIGVDDGKITSIKKILSGEKTYRFSKKILFPAGIDVHVHFRDPGMTHKETFQTGSTAALSGGISCVFDMPNTLPQTISLSTIKDKLDHASRTSLVDFGVHAGITNTTIDKIKVLSKLADGFKVYLGNTTNALLLSMSNIPSALKQVEGTGKPVLFHAEDPICLKRNSKKEMNLKDHYTSRPSSCETQAIEAILKHVANFNVPSHFCHVSSVESVELLKNKPTNVTFGITPHHSLLCIDALNGVDARYKVNPPLRSIDQRDGLFQTICTGSSDLLESDHAPHTLDDKNGEFSDAPSGVPGVETMMPLFVYYAVKEKLSFSRLFDLLCKNPARLMDIQKGSLEVGFDGDIAVFDIRNITDISVENLHSKAGWSPFEGFPAIFPTDVFIRGERLIEGGECIGKPGFGRHIEKRSG